MVAINDVQREILVIGTLQIPPAGQGVFVQIVTPEDGTVTEDNAGPVWSPSTVRTAVCTVNTSQNVVAARRLGILWDQQQAAKAARTGLPNFAFRYTNGNNGTTTTGETCVISKPADPTGQREDADATWVIQVFNSATKFSPIVPNAVV